ncbi:MAG TPA: hypothetical protein VMW08_02320 [Acidimicrobiales bacterium]|nr:hypothetical protein [Acidimicrobiales bacterium]
MSHDSGPTGDPYERPLDLLRALAVSEVEETPGLVHLEAYTMSGLLTILWHGPQDAEQVVVAGGGAMGGLLGPGRGVYVELGRRLAEQGIGTMRVGYRKPNDIEACTLDLCAAIDLAWRRGARSAITLGHSFGGAIALRAAVSLPAVKGVVTYATQSAGCEPAEDYGDRPLLMFHGDRDEILPAQASEMVRILVGHGDLRVLEGAGHLLDTVHDQLVDETEAFVLATLA